MNVTFMKVHDPDKHLYKIFLSEDKIFRNGRAQYSINWKKSTLSFEIKYKDEAALKSVKKSIQTVLDIYNTSKELVRKNGK